MCVAPGGKQTQIHSCVWRVLFRDGRGSISVHTTVSSSSCQKCCCVNQSAGTTRSLFIRLNGGLLCSLPTFFGSSPMSKTLGMRCLFGSFLYSYLRRCEDEFKLMLLSNFKLFRVKFSFSLFLSDVAPKPLVFDLIGLQYTNFSKSSQSVVIRFSRFLNFESHR